MQTTIIKKKKNNNLRLATAKLLKQTQGKFLLSFFSVRKLFEKSATLKSFKRNNFKMSYCFMDNI